MKTILSNLLMLIALAPLSLSAQQPTPPDSLLNRMTGTWILRGTIGGAETTHDITAEWVLNHEYVQIKEVSREKEANGNPAYDAIVYITWEPKLNQYSCLWLDNTGNGGLSAQAVGHAKADGDKIAWLFKGADGSPFQNTFLYNRIDDSWQWQMDGEENGKLQPFARVKLTRK